MYMKRGVGIYIGQTSIVAVEARSIFGWRARIVKKGVAAFKKNSPRSVIVDAIKKALLDGKINTKYVVASLPSEDIIARYFEMPRIPKKNLDTAVRYEAKKFIPFKLEDMVFDFEIVNNKEHSPQIKVLLVATKHDNLLGHLDLFKEAGLRVVGVDTVFSSLIRSFWTTHRIDKKAPVMLVHIDNQTADISIIHKGVPYLSRDVSLGSLLPEMAETKPAIIQGLLKELMLSLEYYVKQYKDEAVSRILLCGTERLQDFAKAITEQLGLPCSVAFSFEEEKRYPEGRGLSSDVACAYGLALKGVVRSPVEIDLLRCFKKEKTEQVKSKAISSLPAFKWIFLETGIAVALLFGFYTNLKKGTYEINRQVQTAMRNRLGAEPSLAGLSVSQLEELISKEKQSLENLKARLSNDVSIGPKFAGISRLLPDNGWLEEFLWSSEWQKKEARYKRSLTISGYLFSEGTTADEWMRNFSSALKQDASLFGGFDKITTLQTSKFTQIKSVSVDRFELTLSNEKDTPG